MKTNIEKVDYKGKEIFIGIDVHYKSWHVSLIIGDVINTKNFVADPEKFATYLKRTYPGARYKAAYEAGCFGFWIKEKLDLLGIDTIVVNPADIPTSDKDKRNKNDRRDSKKIALSLKSGLVKGINCPSRESQENRSLLRLRYSLSKKSTRCKNQIKALLKFYGINYPEEYENRSRHWSGNFLKWLSLIVFSTDSAKFTMDSHLRELNFIRSEILEVTRQIRKLSRSGTYAERNKVLTTIPGISLLGSMTLLTEIVDINRFKSRDEFCSYLGLSPNEHSSGDKQRTGHMTKRCNHRLRNIFIEGSWVAIRKDPVLTLYYTDVSRQIGKQKAIIKVARKLAARTRHILINNTKYVIGVAA